MLDNLEEDSSDSVDEEGNYLVVNEEMIVPSSFNETFDDEDPNCRKSWNNAIFEELDNMENVVSGQ